MEVGKWEKYQTEKRRDTPDMSTNGNELNPTAEELKKMKKARPCSFVANSSIEK
ncbi:hypothetical protein RUM43_007220, partial [Polyplax serrata]